MQTAISLNFLIKISSAFEVGETVAVRRCEPIFRENFKGRSNTGAELAIPPYNIKGENSQPALFIYEGWGL
jgi:hypothetical protein